jgi:hypothetical protein
MNRREFLKISGLAALVVGSIPVALRPETSETGYVNGDVVEVLANTTSNNILVMGFDSGISRIFQVQELFSAPLSIPMNPSVFLGLTPSGSLSPLYDAMEKGSVVSHTLKFHSGDVVFWRAHIIGIREKVGEVFRLEVETRAVESPEVR